MVDVKVRITPLEFQVEGREVEQRPGYLVTFELSAPISPSEVAEVAEAIAAAVAGRAGHGDVIVVSGRGPIYLHSSIAQLIRSYVCGAIVAHYDPKLQAAVAVHPPSMVGALVKNDKMNETVQ